MVHGRHIVHSSKIDLTIDYQRRITTRRKMSRNYCLLSNELPNWREVRTKNREVRSLNWGKAKLRLVELAIDHLHFIAGTKVERFFTCMHFPVAIETRISRHMITKELKAVKW